VIADPLAPSPALASLSAREISRVHQTPSTQLLARLPDNLQYLRPLIPWTIPRHSIQVEKIQPCKTRPFEWGQVAHLHREQCAVLLQRQLEPIPILEPPEPALRKSPLPRLHSVLGRLADDGRQFQQPAHFVRAGRRCRMKPKGYMHRPGDEHSFDTAQL